MLRAQEYTPPWEVVSRGKVRVLVKLKVSVRLKVLVPEMV